jgi:hypothetical protein
MALYKHTPIDLEGRVFRVVRLLSGDSLDIHCEIFEAWFEQLHNGMPYEALSYTWGGTERAATVFVNGSKMRITENLYTALLHLRLSDRDRILWIGAICIDQDNELERGHQVQQMGDIYKEAEQVIIWLGRGTAESDSTMDLMMQLHKSHIKLKIDWKNSASAIERALEGVSTYSKNRLRNGVEALLTRPWFRRIWIL